MNHRMLTAALAVGAALAMAVPHVGEAAAPSRSITPVADSYAASGASGSNYGGSSSLASSSRAVSYLRYVVPPTPVGETISSATLTVRTTTLGSAGSSGVQTVRESSDAWDESALTWKNHPPVGTKVLGSFTAPAASSTQVVTLDPVAVSALAGRTVTLTVTSTSPDTSWLWSGDARSGRPALTLTYGERTAAPDPGDPVSSPMPTATVGAPAPVPSTTATTSPALGSVRNLAFGDSIVEGCCGTSSGGTISEVWARSLGWAPPIIKGSGGTGYLTAGSVAGRVPYTQRIGSVLDANPDLDVLVIEGGGNDPSNDMVAFRTAVRSTFAIARRKAPEARIYVLGPYSPSGAGYDAKRAVIAEEAATAGLPYIDQIAWMKGSPDYIWTDGFHPNAAGHAMLGRRAAAELASAGAPVAR